MVVVDAVGAPAAEVAAVLAGAALSLPPPPPPSTFIAEEPDDHEHADAGDHDERLAHLGRRIGHDYEIPAELLDADGVAGVLGVVVGRRRDGPARRPGRRRGDRRAS